MVHTNEAGQTELHSQYDIVGNGTARASAVICKMGADTLTPRLHQDSKREL
jgi:hypothetical protein